MGVLVVLMGLLLLLVILNISNWKLSLKSTFRVITAPDASELSGLEEEGYISYYYFKELEKRAK